ncbi:cytochrome b5 domain-containing protein [Actinokineospora sp. PR83]|uniref:cytochrome b5-like heme/steroid binding domain-containing protein n=1 Tax=Actinokineospora sp. PR83 TaxID=2884908 RepID=UPI0027E00FB5|nr:cytochrome b5-like heme/steroid binding domain-containing protein [Actinokineospora sp. PR83]MCG8919739.1 cytochrome b5 domain-containing protein [Actinokineospora sp. PR83]
MNRDALSMENVLEKSDTSCPLIVVDHHVLDLTDFLRRHPGGEAVLLANLGRDASADFHHVSAHARPGVRQKLRQLAVAEVDSVPLPAAWAPLGELVDHVRLVRNSFAVQLSVGRDPVHDLVYLGQSYRHLLDDHLRVFIDGFSALLGRTADPASLRRLDELSTSAQARVEATVAKADATATAAFAQWVQQHCTALLDDVIACGSAAVRALRTSCTEPADHVEEAMSVIENWVHEDDEAEPDGA